MLGPDAAVAQLPGLAARALDGQLRALCKFLVAFDSATLLRGLLLSLRAPAESRESGRREEYRQAAGKLVAISQNFIDL